ncbi:MAG: sensor histidine kinase [Bdellovibrionia bacterium]
MRKSIPPTQSIEPIIVINSLPAFIDNLAFALEEPGRIKNLCYENECTAHARQRSELKGYRLEDVISEYHVLARTIVEHLESDGPLRDSDRVRIFQIVDTALEDVTDAFVKSSSGSPSQTGSPPAATVVRYQNVSKLLSVVAIVISGLSLLAWETGISHWAPPFSGMALISPSAALCSILLGVSAYLLHSDIFTKKRFHTGLALVGLVDIITLVKIFQITLRKDSVEQIMFNDSLKVAGAHLQMTLGSAVCLLLIGTAICLSAIRRRGSLTYSQMLALLGISISGWYLVTSLYNLTSPEAAVYPTMGSHASIVLIMIGLAVLVSRPDQALMAIITSKGAGGYMARRMIPAAIAVPVVFGWLRLLAQSRGLLETSVGAAILVVSFILSFSALIWILARQLNMLSIEKKTFQQATVGALTSRDEVQSALDEAKNERALRERVVAAISHDLRGPLTTMKASAELGIRYIDRTEGHLRLFQRIANNAQRADQMIRDLLDANRIRAGQPVPVQLAECDLSALVQQVGEEMRIIHGNRIETVVNGANQGYLSCEFVRRIIENLCTNAIKYGAPDATVTVQLEDLGGTVRLSVHNLGKPLSPEELKNIFDPFRRTLEADQGKAQGWGLGLTLVKGLAEVQGGQVSVRSNPADGTTFIVNLPKDARPHQSKQAS